MNSEELCALKIPFEYESVILYDWFEVVKTEDFCIIRNGLRNCNFDIQSPYYYDNYEIGKDSEKIALQKFNKWREMKNFKYDMIKI